MALDLPAPLLEFIARNASGDVVVLDLLVAALDLILVALIYLWWLFICRFASFCGFGDSCIFMWWLLIYLAR